MKRITPPFLYGDLVGQLAYFTKPLENGCWEFTGNHLDSGYGFVGSSARRLRAHRLAWELANGEPAPNGLTVDHMCHNEDKDCPGGVDCPHRRCVNPDHLRVLTIAENVLVGKGPAAQNARKTHCIRGHEFTPENTRIPPSYPNGRDCRACRTLRNRDRQRQRRRTAAAARRAA